MTTRSPRPIRFARAQVQAAAPGRCAAQVELLGAAATYVGRAEGGCAGIEGLLAVARATTEALHDLGHSVDVEDVDVVQALGEATVVVRVTARHEDEARRLLGFCVMREDSMRATVLAVLNATNRFLEIG